MSELEFNTVKLKNFIKKISKKLNSFDEELDLEVYGVTNTKGIVITGKKVSDNLENYIVVEGKKFVYNPYRINVGSIGISKNDFKGLVSPAYEVFEVDETKLNAEFLYHYLKSPIGSYLINLYGNRGSVRSALRFKDLGEIDIPDLSIEKQNKALEYFKKINEEIDEVQEKIDEQLLLLKKLRERILQEAVSGELVEQNPQDEPASILLEKIKKEKEELIKEKAFQKPKDNGNIEKDEFELEIPNSWTLAKIVDLCFVTKLAGFEYTKYVNLKDSGEVPVIRAQNVKKNFIDKTNLKYIDLNTSNLLHRCALTKESLLVTFIGAGIGDIALFEEKKRWHLAPNVAKLEPFNNFNINILPKYLLYYLLSEIGRKEIFKYSKSTAQPSLSMGTIRNVIITLPPLNEQQRIVAKVDTLMQFCDELEEEINNSKEQSQQLMQSVLREAFKEE